MYLYFIDIFIHIPIQQKICLKLNLKLKITEGKCAVLSTYSELTVHYIPSYVLCSCMFHTESIFGV